MRRLGEEDHDGPMPVFGKASSDSFASGLEGGLPVLFVPGVPGLFEECLSVFVIFIGLAGSWGCASLCELCEDLLV